MNAADKLPVPPPVVTETVTVVPAVPAGDVALNCVLETKVKEAEELPKVSVIPPLVKPVPLTVTAVPPAAGPLVFPLKEVIVGRAR